ncbi:MAG: methyl-accepting chemotaxis protein [Pseudazoarcus pumilus]|nr:methyl-accepting chemotaxis protein [Pseudazoarcus pumilus]
MTLSVRTRLIALATIACLGLIVVGLLGVAQLRSFNHSTATGLSDVQDSVNALVSVARADSAFKTQVQEWKNILIRGNDRALFDRYLKGFEEQESSVRENLKRVEAYLLASDPGSGTIARLLDDHALLGSRYRAALADFDAADPDTGKKVDVAVRGMDRDFSKGLGELVGAIQLAEAEHVQKQIAVAEQAYLDSRNGILLTLLLGTAVVALLAWVIIRRIDNALSGFAATMAAVCRDWDLRLRADTRGGDEIAAIAQGLNAMLEQFQQLVREINSHATQVQQTSADVASAVAHINEHVGTLNDSTATSAASVEQLTVSINQVRDNADQTLKISEQSSQAAVEGGTVVRRTADGMLQTADSVRAAAEAVRRLGEQSTAIGSIVKVIQEVAEQTNLLALNAAIEAARAGEQGRGFAVVADEVRKLAERSAQSAREITDNIGAMQHSAQTAVNDMDHVVAKVGDDSELARAAGEAIERIENGSRQVVGVAQEIANALREQAQASDTLASQIEAIARSSDENAAALGETSSAVITLEDMARRMQQTVARFAV